MPSSLTVIKIVVPGLHHWPDVGEHMGPRVNYLRHPHRHDFHIHVVYNVDANANGGRALEYFTKAEEIKTLVKVLYQLPVGCDNELVDFGSSSCEQIAMKILESGIYDSIHSVAVYEDGGHGGVALP